MHVDSYPHKPANELPVVEDIAGNPAKVSYFPDTETLDFWFGIKEFGGIYDFEAPEGFTFKGAYVHPEIASMVVSFVREEAR